jgi:transposase
MSRVCTVCIHEDRHEIERALVSRSVSYRDIARQYGVSKDAVSRHVSGGHIAEVLARAHAAAKVEKADELLMDIRKLQATTLLTLRNAEKAGDLRTVLAAVAQARQNIALLAEMRGELDRRATVNLHLNPEWMELKVLIVEALTEHPAARFAVVRALQEHEQRRELEEPNEIS